MRLSLFELQKKKKQTMKKYNLAMANLPDTAQELNDAWLELKRIEKEIEDYNFTTMSELYGC